MNSGAYLTPSYTFVCGQAGLLLRSTGVCYASSSRLKRQWKALRDRQGGAADSACTSPVQGLRSYRRSLRVPRHVHSLRRSPVMYLSLGMSCLQFDIGECRNWGRSLSSDAVSRMLVL